MDDIFGRKDPQFLGVEGDQLVQIPGHKLSLKIKQTSYANRPSNLSFEMALDDTPFNGLIQGIQFGMTADNLLPTVAITFIPTQIDIEVESQAVVKLDEIPKEKIQDLMWVWSLNFPNSVHYRGVAHPNEFKEVHEHNCCPTGEPGDLGPTGATG